MFFCEVQGENFQKTTVIFLSSAKRGGNLKNPIAISAARRH
jgi:hypothetical protein